MSNTIIQSQVLYELAMSIGNNLDLSKMLKESIQAYIRKFDFSTGIVFETKQNENDTVYFEPVYSIPDLTDNDESFQTVLKHVPKDLSKKEVSSFLLKLPIFGNVTKDTKFCLMVLADFGLILFIFDESKIGERLFKSLIPINNKLSQACIACLTNKRITKEVQARKESENAALESENRLRHILETVQAGIIIIDCESYEIVDANPSAIRMIGGDKSDIVGEKCHNFICSTDKWKCPITDLDQRLDNSEQDLITISGRRIPVLKTVVPIKLSGRYCVLESFIDLRNLKKAEKERDIFSKRLQESQKIESLGTLAGGIAHDFNNILYAAMGFTELALADVSKPSRAATCLEHIMKAHKRATDLIYQILTFSRKSSKELHPILIQPILREALKLLRKAIPANIEISQKIDMNCRSVMSDPTQIHQVIMNLCTNAYQAMQEKGGKLTVKLNCLVVGVDSVPFGLSLKEGNYILLEVSDTGSGIDQLTKERMFEPFFTTKEVGMGTGMGLSTVHGIVKNFGGVIHVESKPGHGTSFYVFFPESQLTESVDEQIDDSIDLNGSETILFVDDDAQICLLVEKTLKKNGYIIYTSTSSIEALETFRLAPAHFDLVITDYNMPGLTGIELSKRIFEIRPEIPVILSTGYSNDLIEEEWRDIGIKKMLSKPVLANVLLKTIRKVVNGD